MNRAEKILRCVVVLGILYRLSTAVLIYRRCRDSTASRYSRSRSVMLAPPRYARSTTLCALHHVMRAPPRYARSTTLCALHHVMRAPPRYACSVHSVPPPPIESRNESCWSPHLGISLSPPGRERRPSCREQI